MGELAHKTEMVFTGITLHVSALKSSFAGQQDPKKIIHVRLQSKWCKHDSAAWPWPLIFERKGNCFLLSQIANSNLMATLKWSKKLIKTDKMVDLHKFGLRAQKSLPNSHSYMYPNA